MNLDTSPYSRYAIAVKIEWGVSSVARYARWSSAFTVDGVTYTPAPELEARTSAPQSGGTKDVSWIVKMGLRDPVDKMVRPYEHSDVRITIYEMDPYETAVPPVILFTGIVSKLVRKRATFSKMVELEVSGWKAQLQYPLGIAIDTDCAWAFADKNCCFNLAGATVTQTITAITRMSIISAPSLTIPRDNYYTMGTVTVNGLAITILDIPASDPTGILLMQAPPPEWVGATAAFAPGCDGKVGTCRLHNNEQRFGGAGIRIPDYNPMLGSK